MHASPVHASPVHASLDLTAPPSYSGYLNVNLDAIAGNVETLVNRVGGRDLMAVVKADAYGHGLVPSARAALRGGATWLATAQLSEALALRANGITAPVLAWLYTPAQDLRPVVANHIDLSVGSTRSLAAVADAARSVGEQARVHLKIDTGLSRNGATGQDWDELVQAAAREQSAGTVDVQAIWTHFAFADAPAHESVLNQQAAFAHAIERAETFGVTPPHFHAANSAATLTDPGAHFTMVRPGLAVYGLSPVPDLGDEAAYGLTPAMSLHAYLVSVKKVLAGQGVSYGLTYTCDRDTTLGLVPLGYADGIPRNASNCGQVSVAGTTLTIAGRVCMDQFVVDLGAGGVDAEPGDEVLIFGDGAGGGPTAQTWAAATGTINYEIITRIGGRVPRRFVSSVAGEWNVAGQ